MKSILTFILATFLLFPLQAQGKVYTVDNLPKVHLQNKMQYVCNPAGIRALTELCPALTLLNFRQDLLPLLIRRFRRKVVWDMPLSGFRSLVRAANICR